MANEVRGELELKLGDQVLTLDPCFGNLCEIEAKLGYGLPHFIIKVSESKGVIGLRDVAAIIYGATRTTSKLSFDQIGEAVLKEGLHGVLVKITSFIVRVLYPKDETASAPEPATVQKKRTGKKQANPDGLTGEAS